LKGLECRYERFGATAAEYAQNYERTRAWSPFNYELYARRARGNEVTGIAFGRAATIHVDGAVTDAPTTPEESKRRLTELFGLSEEIVSQLPRNVPTPPPPGSRTAAHGTS
jgi:hypothetical protein